MLEVQHSKPGLGADLSVNLGPNRQAHLLLGAKAVTKRIVRLDHALQTLRVSVSAADVELPRLVLIALSSGFARRRMLNKMTYRGGNPQRHKRQLDKQRRDTAQWGSVSANNRSAAGRSAAQALQALYAEYERHLHNHINPVQYDAWRLRYEADESAEHRSLNTSLPATDLCVSVVCSSQLNALQQNSVQQAIDLANAQGFRVALGCPDAPGIDQTMPGKRQFVFFVASDTLLHVHALTRLMRELRTECCLCYFDHDQISPEGYRHSPVFKPEWNPEMLLAANYIGNNFLVRLDWLRTFTTESTTLRDDFTAASLPRDPASLLPLAALVLSHEAVQRIPEILLSVIDPPTLAVNHWPKLVSRTIRQRQTEVQTESGLLPGTVRLLWPLPSPEPSVDIIIPTRDRVDLLKVCVESVLAQTRYERMRIVIVDNQSVESETHAFYASMSTESRVEIQRFDAPFNYSAINNTAVSLSSADVVVLLNNDTEVINPDWLSELVRQAVRPEIGCVGAKLYYSNGMIQHGGVILGVTGVAGHAHRFFPADADGYCGRLKLPQNISAVTAACLAVKRRVYEEVGGLDEVNLKVAYNDVDFCLKVKEAGYRNVWTPYAELYHHESVSRGADDTRKKVSRSRAEFQYMLRRWHTNSIEDPAYNPNLTVDHEDFGLLA